MQLNETADLIEKLGVPIVGLLLIGWGFWKIVKWLQGSLTGKIAYQTDILIQLIDRIRVLQTDILKLDTMVRTKYGLDVDENRISRADEPAKRTQTTLGRQHIEAVTAPSPITFHSDFTSEIMSSSSVES